MSDEVNENQEPTPVGQRSFEEIAACIHKKEDPRLADVDENGRVETLIRDTQGNIMHRTAGRYYGDIRPMVQSNARQLSNADLPGLDFGNHDLENARLAGANLQGSSFHGRIRWSDLQNANLCGVSFKDCNLSYSDLQGAQFDGNTDLEGANLEGAKYNLAAIQLCKNWRKAKGLRMDSDKE